MRAASDFVAYIVPRMVHHGDFGLAADNTDNTDNTDLFGLATDNTDNTELFGLATDNTDNTDPFGLATGNTDNTDLFGLATGNTDNTDPFGLATDNTDPTDRSRSNRPPPLTLPSVTGIATDGFRTSPCGRSASGDPATGRTLKE